jgi:acyl-CoA synthetase (AMP-forming)/AMP-acid ligase II
MMIPTRSLNLANVLQIHAKTTPSAVAAISGEDTVTWGELMSRCNRIANGLQDQGLKTGDKVALLFDNSITMLELIVGTIIAGGVVTPLSGLMTTEVLLKMLSNSQARFVFAQSRYRKGLDHPESLTLIPAERRFSDAANKDWQAYDAWVSSLPDRVVWSTTSPEDSISIVYTSGTTGVPKGMEHSHFSRLLYPLVLGPLMNIDRTSRTVLATPMYHNGTWVTMLPTLYYGGTVVIAGKFSSEHFQTTVEANHCTNAFMVPAQLLMLDADPTFDKNRLASLRNVMVSGAPLPPEVLARLRAKLPRTDICEIYGMGEGFMTFASGREAALDKRGSVGRPIAAADTDIRIIDDNDQPLPEGEVGEIVGTSSFMLKGYHGRPELTRESLWFDENGRAYLRSGDLGRLDEHGYVYLAGRKKDMINSGGVKIYSIDLEEVFIGHPDVLEVAAIGIPHEKWGETPLLLAIMKPSARISEDELMEWGNKQLGKTQRVARVEFRSTFPRNALDKIVKRELRSPYWRGSST